MIERVEMKKGETKISVPVDLVAKFEAKGFAKTGKIDKIQESKTSRRPKKTDAAAGVQGTKGKGRKGEPAADQGEPATD